MIFYGVFADEGAGVEPELTLDRSSELGLTGIELGCCGVEFGDGILLI